MKNKKRVLQIGIHIAFVALIIGILFIIVSKFTNFLSGTVVDPNLHDSDKTGEETQPLDYVLPLIIEEEYLPADDGETTIVCFGNSPFADERNSDTNVCNLIAEMTGATVYNCSVEDSYLSAYYETFYSGEGPMDAFSFYWLATTFCMDNYHVMEWALDEMPDHSEQLTKTVELIKSIDFSKVDVIALMYDGSDYLAGRPMFNDLNSTDIQHFTGSMAAGIELIQYYYPHIRIIVMSPPYAYGLEEDGSYVSSYIKTYGYNTLSTYVAKQAETAYELSVSFVDNLYGSVYEKNAPDYLEDHLHLNKKGRKLIAQRFVDALNMYPEPIIK